MKNMLVVTLLFFYSLASAQQHLQDNLSVKCTAHSHDLVYLLDNTAHIEDVKELVFEITGGLNNIQFHEVSIRNNQVGAYVGPIAYYGQIILGVVVSILDTTSGYRVDSIYPVEKNSNADVILEQELPPQNPEESHRIRFWQNQCTW